MKSDMKAEREGTPFRLFFYMANWCLLYCLNLSALWADSAANAAQSLLCAKGAFGGFADVILPAK
jgi:hypothetical protein